MALAAHLVLTAGGELKNSDAIFRFATGLPSGFLNGVLRAQLQGSEMSATIAETFSFFRERYLPWRWVIGSSSLPADLGDRLVPAGLQMMSTMPGMAVNLDSLPVDASAPGLLIREVTEAAGLEGWLHVRKTNLGLDERTTDAWRLAHSRPGLSSELPLRHFVGWLDSAPVAASTLFVGAGVAGIYHVDVLPQVRGRGFGRALTLRSLQAAVELGLRIAVLTSTGLGEGIYRRIGFHEVARFSLYVPA